MLNFLGPGSAIQPNIGWPIRINDLCNRMTIGGWHKSRRLKVVFHLDYLGCSLSNHWHDVLPDTKWRPLLNTNYEEIASCKILFSEIFYIPKHFQTTLKQLRNLSMHFQALETRPLSPDSVCTISTSQLGIRLNCKAKGQRKQCKVTILLCNNKLTSWMCLLGWEFLQGVTCWRNALCDAHKYSHEPNGCCRKIDWRDRWGSINIWEFLHNNGVNFVTKNSAVMKILDF